MNENINLTKILKDCPKGWKFYSSVYGEVKFETIEFQRLKYRYNSYMPTCNHQIVEEDPRPIKFTVQDIEYCVSSAGEHIKGKGECTFFPSKDQRDWSKFTAPWYKKEKFDPKTLQVFDRVLVKISNESFNTWYADFVAEPAHIKNETPLILGAKEANMVIPYNEETKHLVGTTDEAPEYYRYWED